MVKEKEVIQIKKWGRKFFSNSNKDYKTFDFDSEIDKKLNIDENKEILREKIKTFIGDLPKEKEITTKEKVESELLKQLNEFEEKAEIEFNKNLEIIRQNETTTILEDFYKIPKEYTKMVARGYERGFLLFGEGGLGKTYSVIRALSEEKKEFVILAGHITSLELYHFLFDHKKECIVLDDVNVLIDDKNLNLLKACLSDTSRVVQYHTSSKQLRVPNKFLFEGSIILLQNDTPKSSENLKAVSSRILKHHLKFDYETKIKILYEVAKSEYKGLSKEVRYEIVEWIKDKTNKACKNLNLRLLFTCYNIYLYNKDNWKNLAENLIEIDSDQNLIVQGLSQKDWSEKTGKSRRSYYYIKKSIALQN